MSFFVQGFKVFVVAAVALYAWAGFTGWRVADAPRQKVDPSVRSSPGGYHSHFFWHSGFSGGK